MSEPMSSTGPGCCGPVCLGVLCGQARGSTHHRPPGARSGGWQAELGQDPNDPDGAFATSAPIGQVQWLNARHRTHAHVEDAVKELKNTGGSPAHVRLGPQQRLDPAGRGRDQPDPAWLRAAVLTCDLATPLTPALRYQGLLRLGPAGPPRTQPDPPVPRDVALRDHHRLHPRDQPTSPHHRASNRILRGPVETPTIAANPDMHGNVQNPQIAPFRHKST